MSLTSRCMLCEEPQTQQPLGPIIRDEIEPAPEHFLSVELQSVTKREKRKKAQVSRPLKGVLTHWEANDRRAARRDNRTFSIMQHIKHVCRPFVQQA